MTVPFGARFHRYATLKVANLAGVPFVATPGLSMSCERPGLFRVKAATSRLLKCRRWIVRTLLD